MSKKNHSNKNNNIAQSPTSSDYVKNAKNKAVKNSPYGKEEPSTHTSYK